MLISQSSNNGFISALESPNPITNSYEKYSSNFNRLKEMENWSEILILGNQALIDNLMTEVQKAKTHAQLASCSYYLGDYDGCAKHANSCLEISECLDDPNMIMRALYLLSAYKRGEGNKNASVDPKQADQYFKEARSLIDKALQCFDYCKDDFIKAKVLFNAGAAHSDDPHGDLEIAIPKYQEAIKIYQSLEEYDDFARTSIRLGKVFLLQKRYAELLDLLNKMDISLLPTKTKVHYKYLEAQYFVAMLDYPKAQLVLLDAINDATNLGMETDLSRLTLLLNSIQRLSFEE
ncbi:MAG: hypothetical protein S4CHLAM7_01220 [Chlamydiae bacterium]|nr:hypothetical protein [Chlamydiota bacterium]